MTWTIEEVPIDSPLLDEPARACAEKLHKDEYENILVLVARKNDRVCGALVASMFIYLYKAEIEHLMLYEDCADTSALSALIEEVEKQFQKRRITIAVFLLSAKRPDLEELNSILRAHIWSIPRPMLRSYFIDIASLNPTWLTRDRELDTCFELFSWCKLTKKERKQIEIQARHGHFSYDIFPYGSSGEPETLNSVGLRTEGEVIGWMATHRLDKDTISYTGLYIASAYRGQGLSMALLTEAIRRHQASTVPTATFSLNLKRISDDWHAFVKEGLAPYAFKTEDILISQKRIPRLRRKRD